MTTHAKVEQSSIMLGETLTETAHHNRLDGNHFMSCFMTGCPGKEHGTNQPPSTGRVQEEVKGTTCPTTSQNPFWHPSWLE